MRRVAVVTGGQQGIGFAIADKLLRSGFKVAVVSEAAEDAPAVTAALSRMADWLAQMETFDAEMRATWRASKAREAAAAGTTADGAVVDDDQPLMPDMAARYFRHDLADVAAAPALVARIEAELGPITTLVSNAGVPARVRGDMLDLTPDNFDFVLGINLRGTFFLAQEVARRMVAEAGETGRFRSLVFITSVSAAAASPERAEYCISKAGAAMMAQLFAVRLAPHGIGVFDVRPGIIETAMTAGVRDKYDGLIAGGLVPARRWGKPEDVAEAVLPLVDGSFRFATGAVIPVDGGLAIPRL